MSRKELIKNIKKNANLKNATSDAKKLAEELGVEFEDNAPKSDGTVEGEILESIADETKASEVTRKYLNKVGRDIELTVTGVTNKIALMNQGIIPTTYRDMAELYRTLSIVGSQINAIKQLAKKYIVEDPTAPSTFMVEDVEYTYDVKKVKVFDTKEWKSKDPGGYAATRMLYEKEQERKSLKFKKI